MLDLSIVGFATIFIILFLMMRKYTTALVALTLVPCIACIAVGQVDKLPGFITSGIGKIASTGIMFIFSVSFFGIMSAVGAFDAFITRIIKFTKGDPLKVMLGTWAFTIVAHLDGSGISTILLVVPVMLPIVERLHINKNYFCLVMGITMGIMNAVPWGGPTLRAATVLEMDVMQLWAPIIPTQIFGLLIVVGFAIYFGKKEKARLVNEGLLIEGGGFNFADFTPQLTEEQLQYRRPKLLLVNWILIVLVLGMMVASILSPLASFMLGVVIALLVNFRDPKVQGQMVDEHGKNAIMLSTIIFAAGVLMGVMSGTGMSKAMASTLVNMIPVSMSPYIAPIIGFCNLPLTLMFDADSYYFAIMPIIAQTVQAFGIPAVDVARASIIGQMTTCLVISPMVATFFLFVGMNKLDMGEWQKFAMKYYFFMTTVMTIFMIITGVFSL